MLAVGQIYAPLQPSLLLTSSMCFVIYSISQSREAFFSPSSWQNSESGGKLQYVLLAREVKGGNCIDLSSASFGICPPSSLFFPKVRAFVPKPPVWIQSSKMFCFVSHYIHGKLMSGSILMLYERNYKLRLQSASFFFGVGPGETHKLLFMSTMKHVYNERTLCISM